MPRRGFIPKREVLPDPVYGTTVVTKLINQVMLDGKRGTAQKACYGAFDIIKEKTGREPLEVFEEAMNNIMPVLEVKARRVGGATYQVPIEIRPERRQTLGLRWLVNYARARSERTMMERLAGDSSVNSIDLDDVGAVMEAMAIESYRVVTPAYYEVALKGKYSKDPQSWEMLDMIVNNLKINGGLLYTINISDITQKFRTAIKNQQSNTSTILNALNLKGMNRGLSSMQTAIKAIQG